MVGSPRSCARATTGHAAALPNPTMNSRRRILESSPCMPEPTAAEVVRELWFTRGPRSLHRISPNLMLWTAPPPARQAPSMWVLLGHS